MKILSAQDIRGLGITPRQCIEWIHESFASKQESQLPAKVSVHPTDEDFFTSMPCLLKAPADPAQKRYFAMKEVYRIVGAEPSLGSDLLLYDAHTGELLALVDANWITTMRTGAVAAVAIKTLRKSNAQRYSFVGLGNTARAVLLCLLEQEPERHFSVQLLRYKNQAELFMERFKGYRNVSFEVVDDLQLMASQADVFVSCITSARGLLVPDESLFQPGVTVIPVHMRGLQNCDTTFDRVFADDTAHVRDFRSFPQFKDYNEIGEVLAGRDPGRRSEEQRIIDYNYGLGLHDVVFASKIYEMLSERDDIQEVKWDKETEKFWV